MACEGIITTFYSYKGGVGRSMALANVAVVLARWGYRVLCVDGDLEAPGLHYYFDQRDAAGQRRGLLDLVESYASDEPIDWREARARVELRGLDGVELDLMCAGQLGDGYASRLHRLDWTTLYREHGLATKLELLCESWRREYDCVLIDSRTGITDIGGVLTIQVPDQLVLLCVSNDQGFDGLAEVATRIQRARADLPLDRAGLPIVPVISAFSGRFEQDLGEAWSDRFRHRLGFLFEDWLDRDTPPEKLLPQIRIPYVPRWSFGEALAVLHERGDDPEQVSYSLYNLAALLANQLQGTAQLVAQRGAFLEEIRERARARRTSEEASQQPEPEPGDVFISYRRADSSAAAGRLAAHLGQHFAGRVFFDTESIEAGERFPQRLTDGLARARVALVIMGEQWIREVDEWGRRRLDDPDDWVRREVETLLGDEGCTVIPVLLDGARMPPSHVLPDGLQDLARRSAISVGQATFARDVVVLVERLAALGITRQAGDEEARRESEYRALVRREHGRPPGLFSEHFVDLETVFVELELSGAESPGLGEGRPVDPKPPVDGPRADAPMSLRALMEQASTGAKRRWVIFGHPGAGKSTIARHLAWESGGQTSGSLVVYAALPRLAVERLHPFDWAERRLSEAVGGGVGIGLAEQLRQRSERDGAVWLLLDGLDELTLDQRNWAQSNLTLWSQSLPHVAIAVFTRPIGYEDVGPDFRHYARIQPLREADQDRLLRKWLGQRAAEVGDALRRRPALSEACKMPLTLSLLALQAREAPHRTPWFPASRGELFRKSIQTLLQVGPSGHRRSVKDPDAAWSLLVKLALALQEDGGVAWPEAYLIDWLRHHANTDAGAPLIGVRGSWDTPRQCLEDMARDSGILAPYDGAKAPWRFLHRQFRELLAAEALHARGRDEVLERAKALTAELVPRWAEVLGFACELSDDPLELLQALAKVDEELALRVLPEVERVDPLAALDLLRSAEDKDEDEDEAKSKGWDGDFLLDLFARWREQGAFKQEDIRGWLWRQVTPERSTEQLAFMHYALEALEGSVDREKFFSACERWPAPERDNWVQIPAGTFLMGSPENEPERRTDEGPPHQVTLDAFQLAATAVTNAEYERFDPRHKRRRWKDIPDDELDRHPVVNVSWWEAYLYCKWLGATLPTEAQWEYACRAGTTTPFSFGNNISPEQVNYDGNLPYAGGAKGKNRGRTVPVGSLAKNGWGLYEMHGNVYDWCQDWYVDYEGNVARPGDGLRGIHGASARGPRGGSWYDYALICRSASRGGAEPGIRSRDVGFRPARVIT